MKILYFGTVCELASYEKILSECKTKSSVAPIVFEASLLSGLKKNGVDAEVHSFPMIPAFPDSKLLCWGKRRETLSCGYSCTWLRTVNVPVLKQISRRLDGRRVLKKWLKENRGGKCAVVSYSMPPFLTKDIIKLSRKYGVKCFAVVTDLLVNMYINSRDSSFVSRLKDRYLAGAIKHQGSFDGYIYLTEAMSEVVNPEKPYIVMEGIADTETSFTGEAPVKADVPYIMYAGMIEEEYGITELLDAFERAELGECELWFFGSGNGTARVLERGERDPRIRYFGRVKREEILALEKNAALLVNPRDPSMDFTRFSFPSKTVEYMLSGTPVLTTRLQGIPSEYFDYVFSCADNTPEAMAQVLERAMALSEYERREMGSRARNFILENKNAVSQAARIKEFIKEVVRR